MINRTTSLIGASLALLLVNHAETTGSRILAQEKGIGPKIAWFGVLEDGLAEANRTGKPIFLLSASPSCSGVPGMW